MFGFRFNVDFIMNKLYSAKNTKRLCGAANQDEAARILQTNAENLVELSQQDMESLWYYRGENKTSIWDEFQKDQNLRADPHYSELMDSDLIFSSSIRVGDCLIICYKQICRRGGEATHS